LWDGGNIIYASKGNTNEFWAYYIAEDSWVQKSFVPVPKKMKYGTALAMYNDKVYLLAGGQKKTDPTNFYVYDPTADTLPLAATSDAWTAMTGAPLTPSITGKLKVWKDGSGIATINDLLYALKGGDKYGFLYTYDFAGDTILGTPWAEKETIPLVHPQLGKKTKVKAGAGVVTDGSVLYAIKGGGKQDFWMYTPNAILPDTGVWAPLETIPRLHKKSVVKSGGALAYADGAVWLLKGNNTLEFWKYIPSPTEATRIIPSTITSTMLEKTSTTTVSFEVTPNPFTRHAAIRYTVPVTGKVSLKLYDATGRLTETLLNGTINSGTYTMNLSANTLAKGIYFLKYEAANTKSELKLIVQ
jgi:hypothetical protein